MISPKTTKQLTAGLLSGYGGKTVFENILRGTLSGKSSVLTGPDGTYIDQWFTGESTGGGQELVETPAGRVTRLYAGGTLPPEKLNELGLEEKTVLGKLVYFINEAGEKTRLSEGYSASSEKWKYKYRIIETIPELDLTIAMETITYGDTAVFTHAFLISPIR